LLTPYVRRKLKRGDRASRVDPNRRNLVNVSSQLSFADWVLSFDLSLSMPATGAMDARNL
jgi:hypothetical protein